MMSIILLYSLMLPLIFMFLNHPLSFGLILLLQTLMVSLITGMMNYNFWFSYMLILIMIGGMLILFIYMTSIASNEKFKFSMNIFLMMTIILTLSIMLMLIDQYPLSINLLNPDFKTSNIWSLNYLTLTKYMNQPMNKIMFLLFIYLLITLIMVVKMVDIKHGPIRQKF